MRTGPLTCQGNSWQAVALKATGSQEKAEPSGPCSADAAASCSLIWSRAVLLSLRAPAQGKRQRADKSHLTRMTEMSPARLMGSKE